MRAVFPILDALRRGDLVGARELRLPGIDVFPPEIFGLAETLEVLDLGNGPLCELPADIGRLKRLRALFCSGTRFERLPPQLGDCPELSQIGFRGTGLREVPAEALPAGLRWLTLTDNRLSRLPEALGDRPRLQKLMLAGNRLEQLPESLAEARNLELIRLSANRFEALPAWLSRLPRLAWISWGANPVERASRPAAAERVGWTHLDVGDLLGEGASGRVYRASWRRNGDGAARPVAVKLFKGAMTSDGLPAREMAACLAAGDHAHLVSALGCVEDHPEGAAGLVMPLKPAHWRSLASPPSLESCSRDVYDAALRPDAGAALSIATGVAGAIAHLHDGGLLHGDLYAHNILWDGNAGDAALSDFGAACALPEGAAGDDWRRIEVRAFGLLLEELMGVSGGEGDIRPLSALADACAQPDVGARPLMDEVLAGFAAVATMA